MNHLKRLLSATLLSILFASTSFAQTLNQAATWPNSSWTLGGSYVTSALLSDPTGTGTTFVYDDDDAGQGSLDQIWVESPVIDLTAAFNAGEYDLTIAADYVFESNTLTDVLNIEYFDVSTNSWIVLETATSQPGPIVPTFANCAYALSFASALDITNFSAAQLTGFKYRVFYDDNDGWEYGFCVSSPTITSAASTPACTAPSTLTATNISSTSADLGWTENGTATIWDIEVITSGSTATGTPTAAGVTSNPYTNGGLTAGTNYEFYVRADCGGGDLSPWAGPFSFATTAPACSDPSTLTSANETATTADLGWTENGTAATWDLEIVATGATPTGTPTDVGVTANPFTATGLTASTTYDFYVRADCGSGNTSAFVGPFTFSTTAPPCADPSALASANETTSTADLSWMENGTATTWDLEIVTTGATPTGTPTDIGVTANPFTATGLSASTSYDFYVRADCGSGNTSAFVGPFTFTTAQPGCTDPSTLSASNISTTSADLSWTENGTATTWDIELVAGGATPTGTATNSGVSNPFTATGLTLNTSYDFYVRSDCGGTQSNWVGPFNFSTIAGCVDPSDLGAVNVGDLEADLFWQANGSETDWELEVLATGGTPTGVATDFATTLPAYQVSGLTPGTGYDFYVRAQCGTDFSDWAGPFTFQTTANLAELENSLGVRIAPNPSTGEFNVHMNAQTTTVERLVVYGTNGKVIKTIVLENGQGTLNQSVDLADFSKGMYFISIITDKGNLTHKVSLK